MKKTPRLPKSTEIIHTSSDKTQPELTIHNELVYVKDSKDESLLPTVTKNNRTNREKRCTTGI